MRLRYILAACFSFSIACGSSGGGGGDGDGGVGDGDGGRVDGDGAPIVDDASPTDGGPIDPGCPAYQTDCNGTCIVTAVDPLNCGGCGITCTGNQACSAGACSDTCLGDLQICDNLCVDFDTNNDYCGGCDDACGANQGCVDGACQASVTVGAEPANCSMNLPPEVSDGTDTMCAGDIAETTFRWALCSCSDVTLTNPMLTDGFSSVSGSYTPGGLGGGVGLNGTYGAASEVDVFGDLWASASGGVTSTNPTDIRQELHVGGQVTSSGTFAVGEDAYVAGDMTSSSTFAITGSLHIPQAATITGVTHAGRIDENVVVPPPCDCQPDELINVAGIVTFGTTNNDNAAISLDPDVLDSPVGKTRLDLPCGSYYLSAIDVDSPTVIWVHGRTALFIGGDITSTSNLLITLDPDAELNIFVGGTINSTNPLTIGSVLYPALTRLYVAGNSQITLANPTDIGGFFYAAKGSLNVQNPLEVFGGVYAGDYNADNPVNIHYDREVLNAGDDCPDGGDGCTTCLDCNGQSCNGGTCGSCSADSDCCAPLKCRNGTCVNDTIID